MATPKVSALTPKVGGITPKVGGLTPGPMANFGFSPSVHVNSPAAQRRGQHLAIGSPASFPLTFTPNTAAAAEMVSSLGYGGGLGRTPAYLQNSTGVFGVSAPDENKKRELDEILRTLALKPGRISVEGIERLAKRLGYGSLPTYIIIAVSSGVELGSAWAQPLRIVMEKSRMRSNMRKFLYCSFTDLCCENLKQVRSKPRSKRERWTDAELDWCNYRC